MAIYLYSANRNRETKFSADFERNPELGGLATLVLNILDTYVYTACMFWNET